MDQRVVITGLGVITPVGSDVPTFWQSLLAGRSGVRRITEFDASAYASQIAAEIPDFEPTRFMSPKEAKHTDRYVQIAIAAARQALDDSGLVITEDNGADIGIIIGSGIGGMHTWEREYTKLLHKGPGRVSPFLVPMMINNMGSGQAAILLGAKGPNYGVVSACATGAHAIASAAEKIRRGTAKAMIAGGSEAAICPSAVAGFCAARALSTRNDDPEHASRPFDAERDGFVIGEGAGVIVLERADHAMARGAHIYGELAGVGEGADAYHIVEPSPDGASRAMSAALEDARISPEDVDYVNTHGTSTPVGDVSETQALKQVFGEAAYRIPCSSTKSMTGHLLGSAGAVEFIVCLLAIRDGVVPPTVNLQTPDPDCDLDYVPNEARETPVNVALSNSFGFGGQNACLVARRFAG
jgi:3-oxoacyl-[acyl-carrier-protein] synthase II